jgi:leucyl-tRNA synthetase
VIPDAYIQKWGADTFRMYLMFLGPFQEGGDFRETGIVGIRRFLDKVWTTVSEVAEPTPRLPEDVERKLHQTIRKVTADTESLDYNTAIAAMMEYVNLVRERGAGSRGAVEPLLVMLAPYAPHLAEELWSVLGHERSIFEARWPTYDAALAAKGDVEIVVQVNGRVRGRVTVSRGATEAQVVALALRDEAVRKFVDGKPVRKTIYVQDRLLNLVV